jgi:hypothetical protein
LILEREVEEGGKGTLAAHRPVLLMEVNWVQHALRHIRLSEAMPSLLPEHFVSPNCEPTGWSKFET